MTLYQNDYIVSTITFYLPKNGGNARSTKSKVIFQRYYVSSNLFKKRRSV